MARIGGTRLTEDIGKVELNKRIASRECTASELIEREGKFSAADLKLEMLSSLPAIESIHERISRIDNKLANIMRFIEDQPVPSVPLPEAAGIKDNLNLIRMRLEEIEKKIEWISVNS